MKKLKDSSVARLDSDADLDAFYKDAALDALLYWTNSTSSLAGNNATMALLTEMLSTCIVNMVAPTQVDRAKTVIFDMLNEAFELIGDDDAPAKETKSELN